MDLQYNVLRWFEWRGSYSIKLWTELKWKWNWMCLKRAVWLRASFHQFASKTKDLMRPRKIFVLGWCIQEGQFLSWILKKCKADVPLEHPARIQSVKFLCTTGDPPPATRKQSSASRCHLIAEWNHSSSASPWSTPKPPHSSTPFLLNSMPASKRASWCEKMLPESYLTVPVGFNVGTASEKKPVISSRHR